MVYRTHRLWLAFLAIACLPAAFSQDSKTLVNPPASTVKKATTLSGENVINKIMGVVGQDDTTLTERRRFHLYLMSTVGPVPILAEAAGAGIGQWENSPKSGDKVGARMESASEAIWRTTAYAGPSPTEPPSFFTKTIDILFRISTVSWHERVTRFSARSQLGIRMARRCFLFPASLALWVRVRSPAFGDPIVGRALETSAVMPASLSEPPPVLIWSESSCRTCCTAPRSNSGAPRHNRSPGRNKSCNTGSPWIFIAFSRSFAPRRTALRRRF